VGDVIERGAGEGRRQHVGPTWLSGAATWRWLVWEDSENEPIGKRQCSFPQGRHFVKHLSFNVF